MTRFAFLALLPLALQAAALNIKRDNGGEISSSQAVVTVFPTRATMTVFPTHAPEATVTSILVPGSTFACGDSTFTITISEASTIGVSTTFARPTSSVQASHPIPSSSFGGVPVPVEPSSSTLAGGATLARRDNGPVTVSTAFASPVPVITGVRGTASASVAPSSVLGIPTCPFPTVTVTQPGPGGPISTSSSLPQGTGNGLGGQAESATGDDSDDSGSSSIHGAFVGTSLLGAVAVVAGALL
ncbi:hypothetical protein CC1G_06898 [Coprinopsis cinerea okayama7|uniref:GPI anchored protein n=1 Tax=Coprinopsis cinerea (strain Okayama-7 / 130 / ATCC MYA-4618 / FGSC 9003) TaxID=240176 RepID=A8N726_COPC7|nr:hypothetical protein CC1G_06898 [Coprinopsis cinerea okayama7\|eukprot:XP_001830632.1 hypothetical protein CC1G_06898 [Coprinopsis cinerea okayama7\